MAKARPADLGVRGEGKRASSKLCWFERHCPCAPRGQCLAVGVFIGRPRSAASRRVIAANLQRRVSMPCRWLTGRSVRRGAGSAL